MPRNCSEAAKLIFLQLNVARHALHYTLLFKVPSFKKGFYPLFLNGYFHLKVSKEIENYFLIMIQLLLTSRQSVWWNLKLLCKHCLRDVYTYVRLPSCRRGRRQYLGSRISRHVKIKCLAFPMIMIYSFVWRNLKLNAKNWKCNLFFGGVYFSVVCFSLFFEQFNLNHFWMKRSIYL